MIKEATVRLAAWLALSAPLLGLLMLIGCNKTSTTAPVSGPTIRFTTVPTVSQRDAIGDAAKISTIKGTVTAALPGQQIVLYAHAADDFGQGIWYVQPLVREPFTEIASDGTWKNKTHPGIEYAALLVDPGFQPPWTTRTLPRTGVVTVAITRGWPPIWQNWWFPLLCVTSVMIATFALHRAWVYQMTRKLNLRFEERLAERTRVAQELHDTLLQGVLSASMQLHVALDQMPEDSPSRPALNRILQLMGQVVEEGRNTLRGLRSSMESTYDLKTAFARIPQELGGGDGADFRVIVEGQTQPLRSVIYEDVYSIGREALVNAFRHSEAKAIDAQLEYANHQLRILVRDDGCGIDQNVLRSGRDGHWGLSGMRERADRIGAKLKVMSRIGGGTEVELRVPGDIAFASHTSRAPFRWFGRQQR